MDIYKDTVKRTKHHDPVSGGGAYAGHDGSITVSGDKGVHLEIIPRPEDFFEPLDRKRFPSSGNPYIRKCDFGNRYKAVN
tara:strand:- start:558 stop:797 length:240 start_codon:yes stop_codon:yes gene_type:complete